MHVHSIITGNQQNVHADKADTIYSSTAFLHFFTLAASQMRTYAMNKQLFLFSGMIVAAALSRILPHPPNFTPITAMALFAGATLPDKRLALLMPILAMILSDIALEFFTGWGFHSGMWVVYGTIMLLTLLGMNIQRKSLLSIGGWTGIASVVFFVVTNFAVWATSGMYPLSIEGFTLCYIAAIPFFQNSIMGDIMYTMLLFGGLAIVEYTMPKLQTPAHR
jgi:hypothetical protein